MSTRAEIKQVIQGLELHLYPMSWDAVLTMLSINGFADVKVAEVKAALRELIAELQP